MANSTRRRISRSTTRISTIANVAPRQRRLPPPNGNHVVGLSVAPIIRSGSNRSGSGYTSELLCTKPIPGPPSPRPAACSRPAPPVPSAPGPRRIPPGGSVASPWRLRRDTRRLPHLRASADGPPCRESRDGGSAVRGPRTARSRWCHARPPAGSSTDRAARGRSCVLPSSSVARTSMARTSVRSSRWGSARRSAISA